MKNRWQRYLTLAVIALFFVVGLLLPAPYRHSRAQASGSGEVDYNPCLHLPAEGQQACNKCLCGGDTCSIKSDDKSWQPSGFWTAIGFVPADPVAATRELLDFALGVGGFFVLVQILMGSFQLLTSRGNPQSLQQARERIVNSVIALLFIVFSVTILEFVGVTIFHLPGFFDSNTTSSP